MTATPLEAIDGGRAPEGWERLWAADRWPLRELPHSDLHSTGRAGSILFSGIPQPWLKEAAKRWARAASGRWGAEHDGQLRAARASVQRLVGRSCTRGELAGGGHPDGARGLAVGGPR